jgi:hypothetical protein
MGFRNEAVGGTTLVRAAIKSPNYVLNVTGWSINKDGTAQFTGVVLIGGTLTGTNFIINSSGSFFYSGTPANGNLFLSIASVSGTDGFSNAYGSGLNVGNQAGAHFAVSLVGDLLIANASNLPVAFLYHGDGSLRLYNPAGIVSGNLAVSLSPVAGSDSAGNTYVSGISLYGTGAGAGKTATLQVDTGGNPSLFMPSGKSEENTAAFLTQNVNNIGAVNEFLTLFLVGASVTASHDLVYMGVQSAAKDASFKAAGQLGYQNATGTQVGLLIWDSTGVRIFPVTNSSLLLALTANVAAQTTVDIRVTGDPFARLAIDSNGKMQWSTGAAGLDTSLARSAANQLETGGSILFDGIGTAVAPAVGKAVLQSDTSGFLRYQTGLAGDNNVYEIGQFDSELTSTFTINSTTNQVIFSVPVGIAKYMVEVWLVTQNTTAAVAPTMQFQGPAAGTPQLVDYHTLTGTAGATSNYSASGTYTTANIGQGVGGNQRWRINLAVNFTAAGTLTFNGKIASSTATVSAGSWFKMRRLP